MMLVLHLFLFKEKKCYLLLSRMLTVGSIKTHYASSIHLTRSKKKLYIEISKTITALCSPSRRIMLVWHIFKLFYKLGNGPPLHTIEIYKEKAIERCLFTCKIFVDNKLLILVVSVIGSVIFWAVSGIWHSANTTIGSTEKD